MPAGIKIINDSGTILIDDTFPTLVVRAKGVATIGGDGSVNIGSPLGAGVPLTIALRCSSVVGVKYFPYIEGYSGGHYLFGSPGATVEWWAFDVPVNPVANYGLIVRNSAGQLMFDALSQFLRVVDVRSSPIRNGGWVGSYGYDSSRTWAVMPLVTAFDSAMTFTRAGAGGPDMYFQREDVNVAGGAVLGGTVVLGMTSPTVRRQYGPFVGAGPVPTAYTVSTNNAAMAIVDVTRY